MSRCRSSITASAGCRCSTSYDILDPHVRTSGRTAVLTYRLTRRRAAVTDDWNATQVYERQTSVWRVIHSHWSEVKERQP